MDCKCRTFGAPENNFFTDNIKKRTSGNASTPSSWYPDTADKGLVLDWKEVGSDKYEMTVKEAGSSSSIGSQITENLYTLDSDNRAFLFTQISGGNIDFAAVVKIWGEEIEMDVPIVTPGTGVEYKKLPSGTANDIDKFAKVFCVEVSWPAQAPLQNRERRVFRQEFFNEAFKMPTTP